MKIKQLWQLSDMLTYSSHHHIKKIINIMRLSFLFILLALVHASATSFSQTINLDVNNTEIRQVIKDIEQQTDYRFFYTDGLTDLARKVSLNIKEQDIDNVLSELFNDTQLGYRITDNKLVMLAPKGAMQQGKTITGIVTDDSGEPMPGVNITVKGTTTGMISDADGRFSITVPNNESVLVFSYIGYIGREITVGEQTTIPVTLIEDTAELDEVVVVGYGVVRKRDLTGSVASIKSAEIMKSASNNAMESMQGKVAGLDIVKESGESGTGIKMDLRGNRSINASNDPLILVDGIEYGSKLDLNASDIESMEVLKDASSTAIYGTRGANGVIIITTKRGKSGKTAINFNAYLSSNSPTNLTKVMSAEDSYRFLAERRRYADESATGDWGSTNLSGYPANTVLATTFNPPYEKSVYDMYTEGGVDWFDMILHNSTTQNYELSASGGNDKSSYSLSLGLMDEEGLMKNDEMKRYNIKVTLDQQLFKTLKAGASILYTYKNWNRRQDNVYSQSIKMHTLAQPYKADGGLIDAPSPLYPAGTNPLLNEMDGYYQNNTESNRFFGNVFLEWDIIKFLKFRTVYGLDQNNSRNGIYEDYMTSMNYQSGRGSYFDNVNSMSWAYTWDNTLNYITTIGSNHELNALIGSSVQKSVNEIHGLSGYASQDHYAKSSFYDLSNIPLGQRIIENMYVKRAMLSYFGRINYKLMDKYLLTGTFRTDGSSVLAPGHKWGYFPSVAAAWILSEESFMKGIENLNNLKLRASWGISGNAAVNPYQTITGLGADKVNYTFNEALISGLVPAVLGNKDLTWETTATWDLGLDLALFGHRLTATMDIYYSQTSDLLIYKGLPLTSVYPQSLENVGETENKGFEIALVGRIFDRKDFEWTTDLSFSMNRDKITSLSSGESQNFANQDQALKVGEPVRSFLGYKADGTWSIAEKDAAAKYNKVPGAVKIADLDGVEGITEDDRILYNKSPKFVFGLNNSFRYKDFSLSIFTYARVGQWISYDLATAYKPTEQDASPWVDFWTPENQGAKFPRPGIVAQNDLRALSFEKASFFKIKDITLAYNLPKNLAGAAHLANLKVYLSLKNYFTFSNLDNYDPERGGAISFPLSKQAVVGINLQF